MKSILALLILLAAAAGLGWWLTRPTPPITWQGYADADFLRIGPTLEGKITSLAVARGDNVPANAPLFTQDATDDQAARAQASAALDQAQAQLANLQAGSKTTEIAAARANEADAAATARRAHQDFNRIAALVPSGAATKLNLDAMVQAAHSADDKLKYATAQLHQALGPTGRSHEIDAALQGVAMARAALAQTDWRVAQRDIRAPAAARVTDIYARPGETAGAGAPVVELLPPANMLIRFFVPESAAPHLHPGGPVTVTCDGCAPIPAHITFVSPQVEYTPPVIYSNATTAKLVFLIEAKPAPEDALKLTPGQPVTVQAAQP